MTTNGGNHWENQIGDTVELLTSVYFVDNNIGWAVGENGTILKTTNLGDDWNKLSSNNINNFSVQIPPLRRSESSVIVLSFFILI